MKVHLADVGGIPDPFASRIGSRARSMRNGATGGGGGTGGGEGGDGDPDPKPEDKPDDDADEDDEDEKPEDETPDELKARLAKAEKAATRRENALRKAQAEIAQLREEKDGPKQEDPVAKANARLLNASARTVLTAAGVSSKEDQKLVLSMLDLSDVEIDEDDGPDEDAIEEKISALRRVFGGNGKGPAPGSNRPRGVKTADRGKGDTVDGDTARYRRILGKTP